MLLGRFLPIALVPALTLAAALTLSAPVAAAPQVGMVVDVPISGGQLAKLQQSGARTARLFAFVNRSGPADFDPTVASLEGIGVKPEFVLVGDPGNPPNTEAERSAFAARAGEFGRHLRGRVVGWEVWNEPDAPKWWAGQPAVDGRTRDAAPYARLLKATHAALKGADPGTPVVVGGLTGNDFLFLEDLYRNGAKGDFDAVATHTDTACGLSSPATFYRDPDGRIGQFTFLSYREVRRVMERNDDPQPIWMTEFGWSTSRATCDQGAFAGQKAGGVSEDEQAAFISLALHCMTADGLVEKAMLFRESDGARDAPDERFGVLRNDLSEKPGFAAFRRFATEGDTLAGASCGDFDAPAITVARPTQNERFTGELVIRSTATDPAGVGRISVYADGSTQEIRNFTPPKSQDPPRTLTAELNWQGAKRLAPGAHTLRFVALDRQGNASTTRVAVTKVGPGGRVARVATTTTIAVAGSGAKRTVTVTVAAKAPTESTLRGKAQLLFQKRRKGRWITAHRYDRNASRPFTISQELKPARWRVRAGYAGRTPFRSSRSEDVRFTVR